jgi:hypothetical protein
LFGKPGDLSSSLYNTGLIKEAFRVIFFFGAFVDSAIEKLNRATADGNQMTEDAGNGWRYVRITDALICTHSRSDIPCLKLKSETYEAYTPVIRMHSDER